MHSLSTVTGFKQAALIVKKKCAYEISLNSGKLHYASRQAETQLVAQFPFQKVLLEFVSN